MEEIYELHFHGNRQEIEKEKQRKRELMSHFPKMLGNVDETKYVLQDDNKPGAENHYDKMNFTPLPTVISNKNEKSKEQQSKPTVSVPSFESSRKNIDFDSWKGNDIFLEPDKEKAVKTVPKLSLNFDSNCTKEENNPFQPAIKLQGLGIVSRNKPRTTDVESDSLELRSKNLENIADSLKNGNINYNTNTVTNNAQTTKPDKPGLYGESPDRDYTEELRKIKQNLPPAALKILNDSGIEFVVLKNLRTVDGNGENTPRSGRYYADDNKVYLDSKHVNEYTLLSEAIHAVQDYLGMIGIGKTNLEFQEHVIKDLYYSQKLRKIFGEDSPYEHTASKDNEYIYLLDSAIDKKGVLDLNKFLAGINNFINSFQEVYVPSNSYQAPAVEDYEYNWIKLLQIFGIEYK